MNVRERVDELIRQHMPGLDLRHSVRLTTTGDMEGIMLTLAREVKAAAVRACERLCDGNARTDQHCDECARAIEREIQL